MLFQEIQNVFSTSTNVAGLEPGTNYTAYVSAVYTTEDGNEIESAPSDPHFFATSKYFSSILHDDGWRRAKMPLILFCVINSFRKTIFNSNQLDFESNLFTNNF